MAATAMPGIAARKAPVAKIARKKTQIIASKLLTVGWDNQTIAGLCPRRGTQAVNEGRL